jgi:Flp pilus assembly protein TadB
MLFYPTRRGSGPACISRPLVTGEAGDAMHLTWMLKSFVMGITLLGLSYWLVQIAGVQYLASLTSATLLAFLLVYVVWCLLHKNRHSRQVLNVLHSKTDCFICPETFEVLQVKG